MGKRQDIRNRKNQKVRRQQLTVLIIVVILALGITSVIIFSSLKPVGDIQPVTTHEHPQADGLSLGDANAPVKVVEFSDFQCVACSQWWSKFEADFINTYVSSGKVYFTYSPFSFIGPESVQAAEAAYCANDQGRFWDYHDMLFSNWNGENVGNFSDDRLVAFAKEIGLDEKAIKSCLTSNQYNALVQQGLVLGNQSGLEGTPSFLVNGKLVGSGDLNATIENFLK